MRISKIAAAGAMTAALALAGCSSDDNTDSVDTTPVETATDEAATDEGAEQTTEPAEENTQDGADDAASTGKDRDLSTDPLPISAEDAMSRAADEAGGGIVYKLKVDWSDHYDTWKWEAEVLNEGQEIEIELDGFTGDILDKDVDSTDDQEKAIDLDTMSPEDAMAKALDQTDGRVSSWKLQWDDGLMVYEVEITDANGDETEYNVDTASGNVTLDD
ncbi:MAG: PepSY domain-containing protein [Flaviflexus sp.]|nr:PepSY domain-containing protein [Flaviflexus sp.]